MNIILGHFSVFALASCKQTRNDFIAPNEIEKICLFSTCLESIEIQFLQIIVNTGF